MSDDVFGDCKPITFWRLRWRRFRSAFAYPRMSSTIVSCPLCSGDGVVWQFDRLRAWNCSCAASAIEARSDATPKSGAAEGDEFIRHHCHWPDCDKPVPPAMWGCKFHWFKLPMRLRQRIWATYKPGQEISKTPNAEYLAVARETQDWIRGQGA